MTTINEYTEDVMIKKACELKFGVSWMVCKMLAKISTKKLLWALYAKAQRELGLIGQELSISAKHQEENRDRGGATTSAY